MDLTQIATDLDALSNLDVGALAKMVAEKWGVSIADPVAVKKVEASTVPVKEEQTIFTVKLILFGDKKIDVIKAIRPILALGLKEAKDFVEKAPGVIKSDATREEADSIKATLEAAGATIEIK